MHNDFNKYKISNEYALKNLFIDHVEIDPNPVQVGRIWFNTNEKNYKFSTLDLETNELIIRHFPTLADIHEIVLEYQLDNSNRIILRNSGNDNDILFNLPTDSTIEESINLIAAQITKIKQFLNTGLTSISEFYFTGPSNTITLQYDIYPLHLLILINGLEQPIQCYNISSDRTITFDEDVPIDSLVKIISFNKIT